MQPSSDWVPIARGKSWAHVGSLTRDAGKVAVQSNANQNSRSQSSVSQAEFALPLTAIQAYGVAAEGCSEDGGVRTALLFHPHIRACPVLVNAMYLNNIGYVTTKQPLRDTRCA